MEQANGPLQAASTVLTYAALGAMWNLGGFSVKEMSGDNPDGYILRQGLQTLSIGAIAGVIVAMWGDDPTPGNFELAMAIAIPIFDRAVNAVKAGKRAYHAADDGDDDKTDEFSAAMIAAFEQAVTDAEIEGTVELEEVPGEDPDEEPTALDVAPSNGERRRSDRVDNGP